MIPLQKNQAFLIVLLTILLLRSYPVKAQDSTYTTAFGNYFLFNMNTTEQRNLVRQPVYFSVSDTAISSIFDRLGSDKGSSYTSTAPASPVMLGVKLRPGLTHFYSAVVSSITQNYYSFVIRDSSDAVLVAMGINGSNYKDFRYHVVENDSVELVPWTPVTDLRKDYGATQPFGFIGRFNRPGKWITVEVYNINNYAVREGVIFDWRNDLKPRLEQIIVGVPGNYFNLASLSANRGYATQFDKSTNVPKDFRFVTDSVRSLLFQFKKEDTRVYSVHLIRHMDKIKDTLPIGFVDHNGYFSPSPADFREPGNYELVLQRQMRISQWNEAEMLRIPFEVLPSVSNTKLIKKLFLALGITILALLFSFWIYRRTTRKGMQKLAQQKESAQLKLRSVQSQLNPHFIFNALSSIQNLMNKQSTAEANHYLSRFAALTRATLDSGAQDLISLEQEWKIADNYLQMEQLRFGFAYELNMDGSLQPANIEVPPMLLQPLIENAVKHGIGGKQDGMIRLTAKKSANDLKLLVEDNGRGFDPNGQYEGLGLKLSRERVELLNSLYPGNPFAMQIATSEKGTCITITLNNWLQ